MLAEIYDKYVFNPPASAEDLEDGEDEGYEGATVIETVRGFYNGPLEQVVLLDFARYAACTLFGFLHSVILICGSCAFCAVQPIPITAKGIRSVSKPLRAEP